MPAGSKEREESSSAEAKGEEEEGDVERREEKKDEEAGWGVLSAGRRVVNTDVHGMADGRMSRGADSTCKESQQDKRHE